MTTAPPSVKRNSIFTQPTHFPRTRWESLLLSAQGISTQPVHSPGQGRNPFSRLPATYTVPHPQPHPKINTCATQPILLQEPPPHLRKPRMHSTTDLPAPSRVPACPRHAICRACQGAVKVRYLPNSVRPRLGLGGRLSGCTYINCSRAPCSCLSCPSYVGG